MHAFCSSHLWARLEYYSFRFFHFLLSKAMEMSRCLPTVVRINRRGIRACSLAAPSIGQLAAVIDLRHLLGPHLSCSSDTYVPCEAEHTIELHRWISQSDWRATCCRCTNKDVCTLDRPVLC
ncbi:hypothetical protein BRADI_3g17924v3 [Brachypodium distachyon]|uniref:Uncharacterized protein n=1 Tax=Brachypodium distachyon TaxID=15368 RepID=A0A2K2CXX9_BRADI|nr:hypothetical protein BRADI_3g17924v3 [Brachypodium distachyon]